VTYRLEVTPEPIRDNLGFRTGLETIGSYRAYATYPNDFAQAKPLVPGHYRVRWQVPNPMFGIFVGKIEGEFEWSEEPGGEVS